MDSFSARLNAVEGSYFLSEQLNATKRHMEDLIQQGKLPAETMNSMTDRISRASSQFMREQVPVTVISSRPASEKVFQYNGIPVPKMSETASWARQGTAKVSFGRSRWTSDGASIFSIADGKRLAQTPVRQPTGWELSRAQKIAKASVDERVVQGLRLMPEFTPGRAMLWGSILAIWGTAAITAGIARALDIHSTADAKERMRETCIPYITRSKEFFEPAKSWLAAQEGDSLQGSLLPIQDLAKRMRETLGQRH